jgi:hypothetical protein
LTINFDYKNAVTSPIKKKKIIHNLISKFKGRLQRPTPILNTPKTLAPKISIIKYFPIYQHSPKYHESQQITENLQFKVKKNDLPVIKHQLGYLTVTVNHRNLIAPLKLRKPYYLYSYTPSSKQIRYWFISTMKKQDQHKLFPLLDYSFYQNSKPSLINYSQLNPHLFYKCVIL